MLVLSTDHYFSLWIDDNEISIRTQMQISFARVKAQNSSREFTCDLNKPIQGDASFDNTFAVKNWKKCLDAWSTKGRIDEGHFFFLGLGVGRVITSDKIDAAFPNSLP